MAVSSGTALERNGVWGGAPAGSGAEPLSGVWGGAPAGCGAEPREENFLAFKV